jgi:hypothetical protein
MIMADAPVKRTMDVGRAATDNFPVDNRAVLLSRPAGFAAPAIQR